MDIHQSRRFQITPAFWVFSTLFVVSLLLPYSQFLPWLFTYGLDITRFITDLFSNHIGAFFGWDVIIAVAGIWVAAILNPQGFSLRQRWILVISAVLGASSGITMYLLLAEWNRANASVTT